MTGDIFAIKLWTSLVMHSFQLYFLYIQIHLDTHTSTEIHFCMIQTHTYIHTEKETLMKGIYIQRKRIYTY